jgi:hypothetical protein
MKILLDETTKEGILVKNDGTEVSRYSFKNLLDDDFTFEDLKREIDEFNITLAQQEEFTNIKDLATSIKLHNW